MHQNDKYAKKRECEQDAEVLYAPTSLMHVFVRQYTRLQFDHEREESYEKKKTMLGGTPN